MYLFPSQDNSGPYTYNWDGMNKRTKTNWFGGSNAMIKLIKGFGFFSNLGYLEQTNYAHKSSNLSDRT